MAVVSHPPDDELGYVTDPALETDLDDWLIGLTDPGDDDTLGDGTPDAEVADRLLARLGRLDRKAAEVTEVVKSRRAAVEAWAAERLEVIDGERARMTDLLEGWARQVHDATKQVTWKLPSGQVTLRPGQPRLIFLNEDTDAIAGALLKNGHEEFVQVETVRKVPKAAIKAAVKPGDDAAVDLPPEEGWRYVLAVYEEADPETGEIYLSTLPGMVMQVATRRVFRASPA
jgi:hypothetical protein